MTELFIDGTPVVLPADFSIEVKRENPLITKNGEYTYDITLQLTNTTNATLYSHLNRLNSVQDVKTKRSAILIADNRVYCNGTEIVTGWTDTTVSLQIASGNSELNYFIGGDLKISSLDMKSTQPGDDGGYLKYVQQTYPDVDYCLAPIKDDASGEIHNRWCVYPERDNSDSVIYPSADEFSRVTAQPYLCAYIKDMIRALGYELTVNQLEDTPYKNLYICHTLNTTKWNEMLPGWSVKDFLKQVELLFNVVFLVDNRKRSAKLLLKGNYFMGSTGVHVGYVEDMYEAEVEELDIEDSAYCNMEYKVVDCEYWKYAALSDSVKENAKYETIPDSFEGNAALSRLEFWFNTNRRTDTIYKDEKTGREYIPITVRGDNEYSFNMVNQFGALKREGASKTIELEMLPVTFDLIQVHNYGGMATGNELFIPCILSNGNTENESQGKTLQEMISNGVSKVSETKTNICLAFYTGLVSWGIFGLKWILFPVSYVDEYARSEHAGMSSVVYGPIVAMNGASLHFPTLDKWFCQAPYNIDYTKAVKVRSHDPNVYGTHLVFEIRNKRYVCKDIEFTLDGNGRKGAWTGTFYPIRISDAEVEQRWILTDGKWRDGGVWLDNGRWLDE